MPNSSRVFSSEPTESVNVDFALANQETPIDKGMT